MDRKQWTASILGTIALACGFLLGAMTSLRLILAMEYSLKGQPVDGWYRLNQIWFFALAVYLIFVGLRKVRGLKPARQTTLERVGWGRIVIGMFLILAGINQRLHPTHSKYQFKPSSEAEARGMQIGQSFGTFAFPILGVGLIASAIRSGFKNPSDSAASTPA